MDPNFHQTMQQVVGGLYYEQDSDEWKDWEED
jgi:hypothetical protein